MDQHRSPETGPDVGRTRGKITEFCMKCECKSLSQFGVESVDLGVCLLEREAGMEALEPEVILLVQHHAEPVLDQYGGTGPGPPLRVEPCHLLADQVPFVEQLPVDPVHPVEPE